MMVIINEVSIHRFLSSKSALKYTCLNPFSVDNVWQTVLYLKYKNKINYKDTTKHHNFFTVTKLINSLAVEIL